MSLLARLLLLCITLAAVLSAVIVLDGVAVDDQPLRSTDASPRPCISCQQPSPSQSAKAAVRQLLRLEGHDSRNKLIAAIDRGDGKLLVSDDAVSVESVKAILKQFGHESEFVELGSGAKPLLVVHSETKCAAVVAAIESHRVLVWPAFGPEEWLPLQEFLRTYDREYLMLKGPASNEAPSIAVKSDKITLSPPLSGDAGEERVIALLNRTDTPLCIDSITVDCTCLSASLQSKVIEPHGTLPATITVTTAPEMQDKTINRRLLATVHPDGDTSQSEHVVIPIAAAIDRPVSLYPVLFQLGNLGPSMDEIPLDLMADSGNNHNVEIAPAHLDPGVIWIDYNRRSGKIRLKLKLESVKKDDSGRFRVQAILFDKTSPERKWQIGIIGRLREWISTSPSRVFAGNLRPGEKSTSHVKLFNNTGDEVTLESPDPQVVAAERENDSIRITVTCPRATGLFRTRVLVHNSTSSYSIPITGVSTGTVLPQQQH